jgi:hypothetical protein
MGCSVEACWGLAVQQLLAEKGKALPRWARSTTLLSPVTRKPFGPRLRQWFVVAGWDFGERRFSRFCSAHRAFFGDF